MAEAQAWRGALDDSLRLAPGFYAVMAVAMLTSNPAITWVETTRGGHCAFLAEPNGYDGRWAEKQIIDFISRPPL